MSQTPKSQAQRIPESTRKWIAVRGNATDAVRSQWLGPRIACYILIWEATDGEFRSAREIAERTGLDDLTGNKCRQVRRVLGALAAAGVMVEFTGGGSAPSMWRRA